MLWDCSASSHCWGAFTSIELDAMFITATLTTIGFSVHDTIVVFDRIRENIVRHAGEPFSDIVNHSLIQTLGRSINTSVTTFLTLVALYIFGGSTIQHFVLAILIGIALGTYSSIFNASLLLYSWEIGELKQLPRLLLHGRGGQDIIVGSAGLPSASPAPRRYTNARLNPERRVGGPPMPHETALIATMSVALALAFVGGFLVTRLGLPAIVGYLLAGVVVGPSPLASSPIPAWPRSSPRSA